MSNAPMSIDFLERNADLFDSFTPVDGDALHWPGPPVVESKKWELILPEQRQRVQFSSLGRLQAAMASDDPFWTQKTIYSVTSGRISRRIHKQLAGRAVRKCPA